MTANTTDAANKPAPAVDSGHKETAPKSKNSKVLLLALLGVIVLGAGAYLMSQQGTQMMSKNNRVVKVGLMAPFTGDLANYGEVMRHGVEMAKRDFNKEGLTIEILERNTACDPVKTAATTKELISQGVIAIIGEVCSGATVAALPIANEAKVLLLSPASSTTALSVANDYFFRTYPTNSNQGRLAADLMYKNGVRKLAMFKSAEAYGASLSESTIENFKKLGGTVVADITIKTTDTDFKAKLNQAKAAGADALHISTNGVAAGAAIVVQAKQLNLPMAIYGPDALKDVSFLADVGASGNGMILTTVTPGTRAFLDEYKAAYGTEPANATSSQAYDAYMVLAQAISAGANSGEELRQALPSITFDGKSGPIKFDEKGDLDGGGYLIYTIKDKQFVLVSQ